MQVLSEMLADAEPAIKLCNPEEPRSFKIAALQSGASTSSWPRAEAARARRRTACGKKDFKKMRGKPKSARTSCERRLYFRRGSGPAGN